MALLTENRPGGNEQLVVIRSMRCMTVHTGIANRSVLKEKRPSLLRMALITGLINRSRSNQRIGYGTVGVMAVDAGGLALGNGVTRGQV